jgi:hypothetical protein
MTWQDWPGTIPNHPDYGVLLMGLQLDDMKPKDWDKLYKLIKGSKVTIVEFPVEWQPSQAQFKMIKERTNKQVKMQLVLDLSNNDYGDLSNSWPPRTTRAIFILE